MRQDLNQALTYEFEQALDRDLRRIGEAISPYTRFRARRARRLVGARKECSSSRRAWPSWQLG